MKIRKAVLPIAGLGTRFFPASFACKKEFFPVVGPDGIARPLIHYHLMGLIEAGIRQICLVVQPREEQIVVNYLRGPDAAYRRRIANRPELLAEAEQMKEALGTISFAVQKKQEGLGHAVYQSREFAGGGPVLVCLGDTLFRSNGDSPYQRLMEVYAECGGKSVSAVNRIHASELGGYGVVGGRRVEPGSDLIEVTRIVEKPPVELAQAELRVDGLGDDEFLGWFGMHALGPSIYDVLEEMIRGDVRQKGEIQLTQAQEFQRQREGYYVLEMRDARRYDFGAPRDFVTAQNEFAKG